MLQEPSFIGWDVPYWISPEYGGGGGGGGYIGGGGYDGGTVYGDYGYADDLPPLHAVGYTNTFALIEQCNARCNGNGELSGTTCTCKTTQQAQPTTQNTPTQQSAVAPLVDDSTRQLLIMAAAALGIFFILKSS